jgi:hypothetical protein
MRSQDELEVDAKERHCGVDVIVAAEKYRVARADC